MYRKTILNTATDLLKFCVVILATVTVYLLLSKSWSGIGGVHAQLIKFEIPLVLLLVGTWYFPRISSAVSRYLLPAAPSLVLFGLFDIFYGFLGRAPRLSDLQNIPLIADFSPWLLTGGILFLAIIPLSIFSLLWQAKTTMAWRPFLLSLSLRTTVLALILFLLSTDRVQRYHQQTFTATPWSEAKTIRENGRFTSFYYHILRERQYRHLLVTRQSVKATLFTALYPGNLANKRNIHLVMLESFIDPRLVQNTQFDRSPLAQELLPFLQSHERGFSHVTSPTFGGGTTQAEFELLTGTPALAKLNSIEFNVMKGGPISSFVRRLTSVDYRAVATIASSSKYYNSRQAYQSLGFNEVKFLQESKDFAKKEGDEFIFDGDLFAHNLLLVKEHLRQNKGPLCNYLLGMYGHFPYTRNTRLRPDVVKATDGNETMTRIGNQFYYRTKALAAYLRDLSTIDPTALILVISDHLPPLPQDGKDYSLDKHSNIALLWHNQGPVDISSKKYYQIPWLLWDVLVGKSQTRSLTKEDLENLYYQALAESITVKDSRTSATTKQ